MTTDEKPQIKLNIPCSICDKPIYLNEDTYVKSKYEVYHLNCFQALIKKNILDEIDNRIKLHSLVLIKNKMKYNQFLDYRQHSMKSLREGLREAKNIIMKEFGELE